MKTKRNRLTQVTIAIGTLLLAIMAATPGFANGNPELKIRAVKARGNVVTVTVVNASSRPQSGAVAIPVPVPNGSTSVPTMVTVGAGASVNVDVALPAQTPVGPSAGVVVDDGVPF
jgi:hypothetical protein